MADVVDPQTRSRMMAGIKGKNTRFEIYVRKRLHAEGFRFRLNDNRLPGKPDIVLPKYKAVVFIHGCFWHGHKRCKYFKVPKTRTDFWIDKIETNRKNDAKSVKKLKNAGWDVIVIWECSLKKDPENQIAELKRKLLEKEI